ncbi:MAG TPA: chromosomal replication initiator protein DnaA [Acidimicrobiaceae bacterium]|nr:chromosomal replication initiator protein DnaA [Acidimicrobiaceae bacterium]HCV35726.1 chromosomal replication initiator protein DnaA [Acidimicrobiaceae bacterium]
MANAAQLWESCATAIRAQVSDVVWQMTFSSAKPISLEDDTLILTVPSTVVKHRIEGRYDRLIHDAVAEVSDNQLKLLIQIADSEPETFLDSIDETLVSSRPEDIAEALDPVNIPLDELTRSSLDSSTQTMAPPYQNRHTFEDFVIGSSNRFAHAAAQAVAETPGRSYNPLFIYGGAGLGKTHLLQAVATYVDDHYPNHQVRYVSSETFMNRFVEAIRNKTLPEFKQHYRNIEVLLVDDIQFMEGKEGLQEEFFHTFNSIQQAGGQIVLTSDRSPDSIPTLEERLRSRFKMGLVTHIQPPDIETRLAILHKKATVTTNNVQVPDEVLLFIAENITTNIRELEGALTRVAAFSSLNEVPCTRDMALTVLGDLITNRIPLPITPDLILSKTSTMYGFSHEELIGGSRRRPLVTARQVAMYTFRELTDLSYPAIAREFGGRDHTTVIHAVDKISKLMSERREIYDQVTALVSAIKTGD